MARKWSHVLHSSSEFVECLPMGLKASWALTVVCGRAMSQEGRSVLPGSSGQLCTQDEAFEMVHLKPEGGGCLWAGGVEGGRVIIPGRSRCDG